MTIMYITHTRPDGFDMDRRIDGFLVDGIYQTIDWVITRLTAGYRFQTRPPGFALGQEVRVHTHPRTYRLYVKTDADGVEPNNLLALPRC